MVRSTSRVRFVALAALLLPCACSLITSLDGLSGGAAETPDAARPGDASGDASDASTSAADADAQVGRDAATPFCASLSTKPQFCADFDGTDPIVGWTNTVKVQNSVVEPSTETFTSAPRAIRSSISAVNENRYAFLERNLASTDHVRFSYSIYIDLRPTVSEYEVNLLRFAGADNHDFFLEVDPTGARYVEQYLPADGGDTFTPIPLTQVIPTKTWTRVGLDVSLSGTQTVVVTINGVEAARQAVAYPLAGPLEVRAGITYAGPAADRGALLIDDFLVE